MLTRDKSPMSRVEDKSLKIDVKGSSNDSRGILGNYKEAYATTKAPHPKLLMLTKVNIKLIGKDQGMLATLNIFSCDNAFQSMPCS